jgi:hypothetical protein
MEIVNESHIPQAITSKWESATSGIRAYKGNGIAERFKTQCIRSVLVTFGIQSISNIPDEVVHIHMNLDHMSLDHLWVKSFGGDTREINVSQARYMLEVFLNDRSDLKLTPTEYTTWVGELILLLDGNQVSGVIKREKFIKLFPLWHASRVLFVPARRNPVQHILHSWKYLDVSNSGVLTVESVKTWLLPFAFRMLFPATDVNDSDLMELWLNLMMKLDLQRHCDWINHWSEFVDLNPTVFEDDLSDQVRTGILVDGTIGHFGGSQGREVDLEALFSLSGTSIEKKARIYTLWMVTLAHRNSRFCATSFANRACDPISILRPADVTSVCEKVWSEGLGEECNALPDVFSKWADQVISASRMQGITGSDTILRDRFVDRFLTDSEVDSLWAKFAVSAHVRIQAKELHKLFQALYLSMEFTGNSQGPWIIEQWIFDFLHFTSALNLLEDCGVPVLTKRAFSAAFPLFVATIGNPSSLIPEESIPGQVWPVSQTQQIVYAEILVKVLLRDVWSKMVPESLNMPCQEWWLTRCWDRLARVGRGVTRDAFMSLFVSRIELDRILSSVHVLNVESISKILTRAVSHQSQTSFEHIQEFFLLTEINHRSSDADQLASITPDAFRIAFPLWYAAHGSS